ncbi:MAG: thiamine pyrophosphate-dependent dehydrogenase E1 component subunit alpha [Planctomycetota bacterium]
MSEPHRHPTAAQQSTDIPAATLRAMYVAMLRIRRFEERVADLLVSQEIKCPTHLYIGQEAVAVGVCANLRRDDYVFSTHRSHGHYMAKGGDLNKLMAELYGRKTGCSGGRGGSMHLAAPEVGFMGSTSIVGGNLPLAVGAALGFAMRGVDRVAVVFFGDGASDEGVFHECLNFASLRKLPVLFVLENNLYSSHLHLRERQPDTNLFRKAETYLMPGLQVDGNSVIEVSHASRQAIEAARAGGGPALLECLTYRWRGHVGPNWDLEVGVRTKEEVDGWVKRCPVKAHERLLLAEGIMGEGEVAGIAQQVEAEVEAALTFARESPFPEAAELTRHVTKD